MGNEDRIQVFYLHVKNHRQPRVSKEYLRDIPSHCSKVTNFLLFLDFA